MQFKIDRKPPPKSGKGIQRWNDYPFEQMEVGDHTAIDRSVSILTISSLRAMLSQYSIKSGKKFITRMDKDTGLLHVWRIA